MNHGSMPIPGIYSVPPRPRDPYMLKQIYFSLLVTIIQFK